MKRKKILLVDDHVGFLQMLTLKLTQMGYEVLSAYNGREALDKARGEKPDLIVMDVMMPVMDGFTAVAELRRDPETAPLKVIFLSARNQPEDMRISQELGALEYFTKPFSPQAVMQRIVTILDGHDG